MSLNIGKIADWVTVIGFPLAILSGYIGYLDIHDKLSKPSIDVVIYNQSNSYDGYTIDIKNNSKIIAKNIRLEMRFADNTINESNVVELVPLNIDFIPQNSTVGPYLVLNNKSIRNHKFFGYIVLDCESCEIRKSYIVYLDLENSKNSFIINTNNKITFSKILDFMNIRDQLSFFRYPFPNPDKIPQQYKKFI
jgi:uncharacterized protein (TIGR02588 family)